MVEGHSFVRATVGGITFDFNAATLRTVLHLGAEPEVEAEEEVELTYEFELLLRYSDSDDSESSENASANDSDDDSSDDSDSSDDGNDEGVADSSDGSAAVTETDIDESASVADAPRSERRTKLVHDVSAASESDHSHQSFVQEGAALHKECRSKACHVVPAVSDSTHSIHDAHSHIPDRAAQIDPDVAAQNDSELCGIFDDMDDPVNRASSVSPVKRTGGADLKYTRTKRRRVAEATSVAIPDPPRPTTAVIPAVS
uniref:clumping factor A-like n=1 Tax=Erigeron canadensis TaxID=72917 RepID=UPI001CB9D329|nr:clumping factor A-like [Erigeron canadensis]